MNVIEQNTYHSEKSAPKTKYRVYGMGKDESLANNQSTDVKIHFNSKKGVLEVVKAFSGFNKVIGMALFMIFSQLVGAQVCPTPAPLPPLAISAPDVTICDMGRQLEVVVTGGQPLLPEVTAIDIANAPNGSIDVFTLDNAFNTGSYTSSNSFVTPVGATFAGDFINGTFYALNLGSNQFFTADPSGTTTNIAISPPFSGAWTGLAWDESSGTLYAISSSGMLHIIDPVSGSVTPVNNTGITLPIWLAIDDNGNAYAADFIGSSLYSIDLNSAASALIGGTGIIFLTPAMSADFDPLTGILYTILFDGVQSELYRVDVTTGQYTLLLTGAPTFVYTAMGLLNSNTAAYTYNWSPASTIDDPTLANPTINSFTTTTYDVTVTDACGVSVTASVDLDLTGIHPGPGALGCSGNINIPLGPDCETIITANMVLEPDVICEDLYIVSVNGGGNTVDASDIGNPITISVSGPGGFNCWNDEYLVEDKLDPSICCTDLELSCTEPTDPDDLTGTVLDTRTYGAEDLPAGIPDFTPADPNNNQPAIIGKVEIEFNVPTDCPLGMEDVNLLLDIDHPYPGDLKASLKSPKGTVVQIFDRPGTPIPTPPFGCNLPDIVDATFDDESTNPYTTAFDVPCPVTTSSDFQPIGSLSDFKGENPKGTWILTVFDLKAGDIGTVEKADLTIETIFPATGVVASDNCGGPIMLTWEDEEPTIFYGCGNDIWETICRNWTAKDQYGNTSTCKQYIHLTRPSLDDVVGPCNYDDKCFDPDLIPDPLNICPAIIAPVCGCDGVTYNNDCEAENAGIRSWTPGPCTANTCPGDPLEYPWLQALIEDCENNCSFATVVEECSYLGQAVIVVREDNGCPSPMATVYDCAGNVVIPTDLNTIVLPQLTGCNPIFECGQDLPKASKPVLSCTDDFPLIEDGINEGNPHPDYTGYPEINGKPVDGECMFYCNFVDKRIEDCEGSYIIVRKWTCYDWCPDGDPPITCDQIIKVMDNDPPVIDECPDPIETPVWSNCKANTILPIPEFHDDCSDTGKYFEVKKENCSTCILEPLDPDEPYGPWILKNQELETTVKIIYTLFDGCGNSTKCDFLVTAVDETPPTPICHSPIVGLSSDITYVYWYSFDDFSHDNCEIEKIEVRRLKDCMGDDIIPVPDFSDKVPFTCCDVGNPVEVEMRVTDVGGLFAICSVDVVAQDQTNPVITCPPSKDLTCPVGTALDTYDGVTPNLPGAETFLVDDNDTPDDDTDDISTFIGYYADVTDNCPVIVEIREEGSINACGRSLDGDGEFGPIKRTYTAIDPYGNEDSCEQFIDVTDDEPFNGATDVAWPNHVVDPPLSCEVDPIPANLPAGSKEPIIDFDAICDNIALSVPEDLILLPVSPSTADYCFKIKRTWEVIDWCNIDIFGDPARYEYEQIIKIVDDVPPVFISCSVDPNPVAEGDDIVFSVSATDCTDAYSPEVPGVTYSYAIDQGNDDPDNPEFEGPGTLGTVTAGGPEFPVGEHLVTFTATDYCGNVETCSVVVTVENLLTCEGVVSTALFEANVASIPSPHFVFANELGLYISNDQAFIDGLNPEISLTPPPFNSTSISFDCSDIIGNAPTPVLVYLEFDDGTGGRLVCEKTLTLVDQTNPEAVCLEAQDIPVITLVLDNDVHVFDENDFGLGSFDVLCTTNFNDLDFAFSPASVSCNDLLNIYGNPAVVPVEMTVTDLFGNFASCTAMVPVVTFNSNCAPAPPTFNVSGGIENEEGASVEYVDVEVAGDINDIATTGDDGAYSFNLPSSSNYTINPELDINVLNGVSTYDLVLISKHILQFQLLESPYKIIAADVNHSGTVSTIDLVSLRKVILFIDDEFPDNTSWRFVDAEFVFPNPADPFSTSFPEVYTINGLTQDEVADFVGVKIGDVNCSATPNDLMSGDDRNADGELVFTLAEQSLKAGETYEFNFEATDFDQVQGFQFTMSYNPEVIEFNDVEARDLANINSGNFGLHKLNEGVITASWNTLEDAQTLENGKVLFTFSFTALEDAQLSDLIKINSRFTRAEAYDNQGLLDLSLQFVDENGTITAEQFELYQNQPNPFKDETVIGFYLPESGKATFKVFDISGREIKTVEGDYTKGYNEISINRSELQSTGVLYYQLESAEHIASKKMVLLD